MNVRPYSPPGGESIGELARREFGLVPELKRAAYIGIWGLALSFVFASIVATATSDTNDGAYQTIGLTAAASCAVSLLLTWWVRRIRYRVDAHGVHRRILIRWKTWPWETFGVDNVRVGSHRYSFVFPDLPLWSAWNIGGGRIPLRFPT